MEIKLFKRKNKNENYTVQTAVSDGYNNGMFSYVNTTGMNSCERKLYKELRESVPVIDAAIGKIIRLVGSFRIRCSSEKEEKDIGYFLDNVRVNSCGSGINGFLAAQLDQMITYGTAVGEIVLDGTGKNIAALYNADLKDVEICKGEDPFDVRIYNVSGCERVPVRFPALVLCSTLMNEPGKVYGTSVLKGLPFVGDVLMKIFHAIGTNWDRVGNVRFAVSYKPGEGERSYSKDRARLIAEEWSKAMKSSEPKDFVSVGDVSIRVIGADNQLPDSQVPARLLMEQILSKLSVPPFLLGLSWSSTERMSSQQADILTSELEFYRRCLEGNIRRICDIYFKLRGVQTDYIIEWDNINLQDEVELAKAALYRAQEEKLKREVVQQ